MQSLTTASSKTQKIWMPVVYLPSRYRTMISPFSMPPVWLRKKPEKGNCSRMGKKMTSVVVLNSALVLKNLSALIFIFPTHKTARQDTCPLYFWLNPWNFYSLFGEFSFPSYFPSILMDSKAIRKEESLLAHLVFPLSCYAIFLTHLKMTRLRRNLWTQQAKLATALI